ncbi:MAG: sulfite exporter TauE/SafE family protein [Bacteroidota bacterium]
MELEHFLLPFVAFAAFFVKAVSGFGPALVVIGIGSMVLPPHTVVPLSAMLDATAGAILFFMDPVAGGRRYWLPLAVTIVVGSVAGGILLSLVSPDLFRLVLGIAILMLAVWFTFFRSHAGESHLTDTLPSRASAGDMVAVGSGGLMGGFLRISGPPVLWHFGRQFAKRTLRQVLIPIFLAAAVARVATYSGTGLVDQTVLLYYCVSLPGLLLGIYVGNKVFLSISEKVFSRAIGLILLAAGLRLLLWG